MNRKTLFITILLFIISSVAKAETSAEAVLKKFLSPDGISNKEVVYTGEMLRLYYSRPTLGENLPDGASFEIRQIDSSKQTIVFAVTIAVKDKGQDWYVYLCKEDNTWKLEAVRTLASTGVLLMALDILEEKDRNEEEYTYQNILLTIKSDKELKQFVIDNNEKLFEIVNLINDGKQEQANKKAIALNLASVSPLYGRVINILIGGILDNTVGIIYVPDGAYPPKITMEEYIYVEKVLDYWYLYKTT